MTPSKEDWYTVPDCPEYFVSTEGRVIGPLRMVLKPVRGTWVTLRHRNGNYIKRKVQDLLQQSMVVGEKVRDPHIIPPAGFVKIDAYPNYYINPEGHVWSDISGKCIRWSQEKGSSCPSVWLSTISSSRQVNVLLEMAFGEGAAEYAGFPAPRKNWHARGYAAEAHKATREKSPRTDRMGMEKRMPAGSVAPKRKCHDCGRPTPDYRCAHCLSKWREKYGVSPNADGASFDVLYYGGTCSPGGRHAHQE